MSEALPNLAVVVNEVTGNWSPAGHLGGDTSRPDLGELRALVAAQLPALSAPRPPAPRSRSSAPPAPRLPVPWSRSSAPPAPRPPAPRSRSSAPPAPGPTPSAPVARGSHASGLRASGSRMPGSSGSGGLCLVCTGPAGRGRQRCYHCSLHVQCAGDSLADLVVPVTYALKGSQHARQLWHYKYAGRPTTIGGSKAAASAGLSLLALLLVFLRDHGNCLWRRASWHARPTHLAVVPSARSRPGPHPLRTLIEPYLRRPWAEMSAEADDQRTRELDPGRFTSAPVPGARVLLMDDTWTTGASAQSAAMALRRAGARSVVTVVIGRHLSLAPAELANFGPASMPFSFASCAVHDG